MNNILLINQPLNNRGDESAHRALIRKLKDSFPKAKITVLFLLRDQNSVDAFKFTSDVDYVNIIKKRHNYTFEQILIKSVQLGLWLPFTYLSKELRLLVNFFKSADVIINSPGGICLGGFQNWIHLYQLLLAKHLKKKVIYYSRSIGPFKTDTLISRLFKKLSYEVLKNFDFLSIRDMKSSNLLSDINIPHIKSIDTAFLDDYKSDYKLDIDTPYIVFVPNQLKWHFAFKNVSANNIDNLYKEIVCRILKEYPSYKVVLLPQLFSMKNGDHSYFKHLQKIINDPRVVVLSDNLSSDQQQAIIRNAIFLIGARYHSVVFAINNNTPFVSLSYEHKMTGLLSFLDLSDREIRIDNLDWNSEIVALLDSLIEIVKQPLNHDYSKIAHRIAQDCYKSLMDRL